MIYVFNPYNMCMFVNNFIIKFKYLNNHHVCNVRF